MSEIGALACGWSLSLESRSFGSIREPLCGFSARSESEEAEEELAEENVEWYEDEFVS